MRIHQLVEMNWLNELPPTWPQKRIFVRQLYKLAALITIEIMWVNTKAILLGDLTLIINIRTLRAGAQLPQAGI